MNKTLNAGATPEITILEISGDLNLTGHDDEEVIAEYERGDVSQEGNTVTVRCESDCNLRVPRGASVRAQSVGGDLSVNEIGERLDFYSIGGDLTVGEVGPLHAKSVGGDVNVGDSDGEIGCESVGGDFRAPEAKLAPGTMNVGGDAAVFIEPAAGVTYQIHAGGDIVCELSDDANARVDITDSDGVRKLKFGSGNASVKLTAGGDVVLDADAENVRGEASGEGSGAEGDQAGKEFEFNFGPAFDDSFRSAMGEFERQMRDMQRNIDDVARQYTERFANFGVPEWKVARAQERAQAAARRMEEKMARKMAKMQHRAAHAAERAARHTAREAEREARRAQRRAERQGRGFNFTRPNPPQPSQPSQPYQYGAAAEATRTASSGPTSGPTDEERAMILRMLQEKKITLEQAEQLLAALDQT